MQEIFLKTGSAQVMRNQISAKMKSKSFKTYPSWYKYLQIANMYMYVFYIYTYIYNPYSNSFFILHALIHSCIVLKPELKGFGGGFPYNHHHLGWPTGGNWSLVLRQGTLPKLPWHFVPSCSPHKAPWGRTPDMKIPLWTSLRCVALMKWRQNLAPLNFRTTFKLGVCALFLGGGSLLGEVLIFYTVYVWNESPQLIVYYYVPCGRNIKPWFIIAKITNGKSHQTSLIQLRIFVLHGAQQATLIGIYSDIICVIIKCVNILCF